MLDLAFDEMSHWSFPQLRRGAFCDVERRRNHLAGGSVHADKMDEAREILQVCEIYWVKVNALRFQEQFVIFQNVFYVYECC